MHRKTLTLTDLLMQKIHITHRTLIQVLKTFSALILAAVPLLAGHVSAQMSPAQAGNGMWLPAVNLSRSGTASQPIIATGGNGLSHVMWWDSFDGIRYARVTSPLSETLALSATNSIPLLTIYGDRQTYFDNRLRKQVTEIRPPRDMRLLSDQFGSGHVLWENLSDQLLYSVNPSGAIWSPPVLLEQTASAFDATVDVSRTLHIAYVRAGGQSGLAETTGTATQPGLYYRSRLGAVLSAPIAILPSNYLRAERADDLALSIASNGQGSVVVTWFQPSQNQSYYVVTTDRGKTWSQPQPVPGVANRLAIRSSVAATSLGEFLLIYRDGSGNGCSFNQRRSADGGKTWSAPQIVLTDVTRCPQHWRFANADNKLWIVGTMNQSISPLAAKGTVNITTNMLAAWDDDHWSPSAEINLNAFDGSTNQGQQLSCFNVSLSGSQLLGVGCDARGDIWTSKVGINLSDLMKAPDVIWQRLKRLSNTKGPVSADVVMAHQANEVIGMWAQSELAGAPANEVYLSRWNGTEWTQPARVLLDAHSRFEQLALAVAPDERLHLVWTNDRVYYTQSFVRDSGLPEGWAKPVALPAPMDHTRSPSLVVDPRGSALYVAYAVPYNEMRGVYLVRSTDNGQTWQAPQRIFDAAAAKWDGVDQPVITLDARTNTLHAAWLKVGLNNTVARTIFYSKSTDVGKTWSKPVELGSGLIEKPQMVISGQDQIYIEWHQHRGVYDTAVPYEAFGRFSADSGANWSDTSAVAGFGELSGKPALVTDAAGHIYLVAMTENTSREGRMIFSQWTGKSWSTVEGLGVSQRSVEQNQPAIELLPQSGQLVVLARTQVMSDSGQAQFELFSTARLVQPVDVQTLPTLTPATRPTTSISAQPTPSEAQPTPVPEINKELQPEPRMAPWLMTSVIGGVVFLGLVIIGFGFYRNRQRG